jgi:hypothetical protein
VSLLALLAIVYFSAPPARAWEAKAKDIEARLKSHPHPMGAPPARKPGWVKKVSLPKAKPYWVERWNGRSYLFGAGEVRDVENSALRVTVSGDRARASLALGIADLGLTPKGPEGEKPDERERRVEQILIGSQVLDWYLEPDGRMYALSAVIL